MSLLLLFPQEGGGGETTLLLPQFPLSRRHPLYQPSYIAGLRFALKAVPITKEPMHPKEITVLSGAVAAVGGVLAAVGVIPPDVAIGAASAAGISSLGAWIRSKKR